MQRGIQTKFTTWLLGVCCLLIFVWAIPANAVDLKTCICYLENMGCLTYDIGSSHSCDICNHPVPSTSIEEVPFSAPEREAKIEECNKMAPMGAEEWYQNTLACFCYFEDGNCETSYIYNFQSDCNQECQNAASFKESETRGDVFDELNRECIASAVRAEGLESTYTTHSGYKLEVDIGQITEVRDLTEYINSIYEFLVGAVGIVATVMIMWGGVQWVFAAGDSGKISKAKKTVIDALIGLVLALASYLILNVINPELVGLSSPKVPAITSGQQTAIDVGGNAAEIPCEFKKPSEKAQGEYSVGSHACAGTGDVGEKCYCLFNSNCQPAISGACAASQMETYFGDNKYMASAICQAESGGNPAAGSDCVGSGQTPSTADGNLSSVCTDYCHDDPQWRGFSVGLFQINLNVNPLKLVGGGDLDCDVFTGFEYLFTTKGYFNCTITDDTMWSSCMATGSDPAVNKKTAAGLSQGGKYWNHWTTNNHCGFPTEE